MHATLYFTRLTFERLYFIATEPYRENKTSISEIPNDHLLFTGTALYEQVL